MTSPITRRDFINLSGVALLGTVGVVLSGPARPAGAASTPTVNLTSGNQVRFFSGGFTETRLWELSQMVELVWPQGEYNRVAVELSSDSRAIAVGGNAARTVNQRTGLNKMGVGANSGHVATHQFDLDLPGRDSQLELMLPLAQAALFPHDNVDSPVLPTLRVEFSGPVGGHTVEVDLATEEVVTGVAPWALVPAVSWEPLVSEGTDSNYMVPTVIACQSLGPNPVPVGCEVQVRLDGRACVGAVLDWSGDDAGNQVDDLQLATSTADGQLLARLTTTAELPVGVTRVARLSWQPGNVDSSAGFAGGVVRVGSLGDDAGPRRLMGPGEDRVAGYLPAIEVG